MIDFGKHPKFLLGELVEFLSTQKESGLTTLTIKKGNKTSIFKTGNVKMVPPTMIVTEIVVENIKNEKLFDEKNGHPIKDSIKICCQWFSHQTNKFQTRWFNIGVLSKTKNLKLKKEEFHLNQVVVLKTITAKNIQSENIIKHKLLDELEDTDYKLSQVFDNAMFLPPKMVVTGIEENKDDKPIYDKATGRKKRETSVNIIKCMWYDYTTGKFSENHFIKEVLMSVDKLDENYFLDQFSSTFQRE